MATEDPGGRPARQVPLAEDSVEDLYENAPCGYLASYPDGRIARVNQTFLVWTGYSREHLLSRCRFVDLLGVGSRIYHETHYAPLLQMQGSVKAIALDLVRADGSVMPILVNARMRTDETGRPLGVRTTVFDATDRKRYETELLAARRRAERSAFWLTAVERVVAELAAASAVAEVAAVIARAGTDAFGATASVLWLAEDATGENRWAAGSGAVGQSLDLAADDLLGTEILRSGDVMLIPGVRDSPELATVRAALGHGDGPLVLVPLPAATRPLGLLALLKPALDPEPEELRLLKTLGQQAGQALERARLYDEQSSVARTLQRSLLPRTLPVDPRLLLSACYRPALDSLAVGGDWYDAYFLDRDRVAVVVGDVVGRGVHAAAAMGQLRSAVRALTTLDSGPALLLDRLDRFVEDVPGADTATMIYAEVDLRDGDVRYSCAGHPPPVLIGQDGVATVLWDGRSTPLGAGFGIAERTEGRFSLAAGSRLAVYTDGLVERRDEALDEGINNLAAVLGGWSTQEFEGIADAVTDAAVGSGPTGDDVCLLVLAYLGPATP